MQEYFIMKTTRDNKPEFWNVSISFNDTGQTYFYHVPECLISEFKLNLLGHLSYLNIDKFTINTNP